MVRRLAVLAALGLAACSATPAREAARTRPTLVSLNPCTDAILAEVADADQILAISAYSHDPASSSMDLAAARRFAATGGSVEEVLALRPDVVVGSTFMSPATSTALRRLGFRLEQVGIAPSVAESEAQVRSLAALAGHPERGEALVARIEASLARALFEAKLMVHSAHIATYGERAVDTFYVTDLLGEKIDAAQRLKAVEKKLLEAADEQTVEVAA